MSKSVFAKLNEAFTILEIDFKSEGTFLAFFDKSDVSDEESKTLLSDYNSKYETGEYDGTFQDYLDEKEIDYHIIEGSL